MARILPPEWHVQINGEPVSGAKVFFYITGTTTKVTTFSDDALTVDNTNPIICDADGKIGDVFKATTTGLKMVVAPSNDTDPPTAPINTYDPVNIDNPFNQDLNTTDTPNFVGITFGSETDVLDDYQENLFVTTITADSGTITLQSAFNTLSVTKMGRVVVLQGNLRVDSVSSPTGIVQILVPFDCATLAENSDRAVGSPMISGLSGVLSGTPYLRTIDGSDTVILLDTDGVTSGSSNAAKFISSTQINVSITYFTDE